MDRGAWQDIVHGVKESDTTEQLTYTHTVASKCSSGKKSCMSLTLNKKLERVNLSEESMSESKTE